MSLMAANVATGREIRRKPQSGRNVAGVLAIAESVDQASYMYSDNHYLAEMARFSVNRKRLSAIASWHSSSRLHQHLYVRPDYTVLL